MKYTSKTSQDVSIPCCHMRSIPRGDIMNEEFSCEDEILRKRWSHGDRNSNSEL
jgi:hypothetical protein